MTAAPRSLREIILECVAEEPGSTVVDIRELLLERGMRVEAAVVVAVLSNLTQECRVLRQKMKTGGRPVYCFRPVEVS